MNKFRVAVVAAAVLALAACGRKEENVGNAENVEATTNLDELANETANQAEAEALGTQQAQLNNEAENNTAGNDLTPTENPDENVSGM